LINQSFLKFGYYVSFKFIDRGFIEMLGPFGLSTTISEFSFNLKKLHNGIIYQSTLLIISILIIFIFLIINEELYFVNYQLILIFLWVSYYFFSKCSMKQL